jgi:hypothetical protein
MPKQAAAGGTPLRREQIICTSRLNTTLASTKRTQPVRRVDVCCERAEKACLLSFPWSAPVNDDGRRRLGANQNDQPAKPTRRQGGQQGRRDRCYAKSPTGKSGWLGANETIIPGVRCHRQGLGKFPCRFRRQQRPSSCAQPTLDALRAVSALV